MLPEMVDYECLLLAYAQSKDRRLICVQSLLRSASRRPAYAYYERRRLPCIQIPWEERT